MNHVQRRLEEVEVSADAVGEALQCLLHTIIFARWPTVVRPRDHQCTKFPGIAYASCGDVDINRKVNATTSTILDSLEPAGPDLQKGTVTLTFFKRRTGKVVFWAYEEKMVWEQWNIPVLVNTEVSADDQRRRLSAEERDQHQRQREARCTESLQQRVMEVLCLLNDGVEHVPPATESSHDFEISCAQREQREPLRTRVMTAPSVVV